jgi:dihydrofolate reductase
VSSIVKFCQSKTAGKIVWVPDCQRFVKPPAKDIPLSMDVLYPLSVLETLMRKVLMFNMISLDGYFEGPSQEIDWHMVDEEFNQYAAQQFNSIDTLLFGRTTYLLMAGYWPTPLALKDDPLIAKLMNETAKIVFSRTLEHTDWQKTTLNRGDAVEEVRKLKQLPGKDMMIFGSGKLVSSLAPIGLIDELRLMVDPVVLGKGNPLFMGIKDRLHYKRMDVKNFRSGNVLVTYEPEIGKIK